MLAAAAAAAGCSAACGSAHHCCWCGLQPQPQSSSQLCGGRLMWHAAAPVHAAALTSDTKSGGPVVGSACCFEAEHSARASPRCGPPAALAAAAGCHVGAAAAPAPLGWPRLCCGSSALQPPLGVPCRWACCSAAAPAAAAAAALQPPPPPRCKRAGPSNCVMAGCRPWRVFLGLARQLRSSRCQRPAPPNQTRARDSSKIIHESYLDDSWIILDESWMILGRILHACMANRACTPIQVRHALGPRHMDHRSHAAECQPAMHKGHWPGSAWVRGERASGGAEQRALSRVAAHKAPRGPHIFPKNIR